MTQLIDFIEGAAHSLMVRVLAHEIGQNVDVDEAHWSLHLH